jgi:hypothetical protein
VGGEDCEAALYAPNQQHFQYAGYVVELTSKVNERFLLVNKHFLLLRMTKLRQKQRL